MSMKPGAKAVTVTTGTTSTAVPAGENVRLCGWSVRETSNAAFTVTFRDGSPTSGNIVGKAAAGAGSSASFFADEFGVRCPNGIGVQVTAGTCEVTVYYRDGDI
jgi:hypothetical protein